MLTTLLSALVKSYVTSIVHTNVLPLILANASAFVTVHVTNGPPGVVAVGLTTPSLVISTPSSVTCKLLNVKRLSNWSLKTNFVKLLSSTTICPPYWYWPVIASIIPLPSNPLLTCLVTCVGGLTGTSTGGVGSGSGVGLPGICAGVVVNCATFNTGVVVPSPLYSTSIVQVISWPANCFKLFASVTVHVTLIPSCSCSSLVVPKLVISWPPK